MRRSFKTSRGFLILWDGEDGPRLEISLAEPRLTLHWELGAEEAARLGQALLAGRDESGPSWCVFAYPTGCQLRIYYHPEPADLEHVEVGLWLSAKEAWDLGESLCTWSPNADTVWCSGEASSSSLTTAPRSS